MHCYVRKSSIYPSTAQCLTIHHTCWSPFLAPISVQFLILMSLQKPTHINGMFCCLYNFISTHKTSAIVVAMDQCYQQNNTCAQTEFRQMICGLNCNVSRAHAVRYAMLLQWFWGQVQNLVHVQVCQRGFKCSDTTATKIVVVLWGRGGYGTVITICENTYGLYKTNNKEIVIFCVFV
jgi:hypothetical protein